MKRRVIGLVLVLVLALTTVLGSVSTASAAQPQSWVTITNLQNNTITFNCGWSNVGVYQYSIYVQEQGNSSYALWGSGLIDLGVRTTSAEFTKEITTSTTSGIINHIDEIDEGDYIRVQLRLFRKNGRQNYQRSVVEGEWCPYPPPA